MSWVNFLVLLGAALVQGATFADHRYDASIKTIQQHVASYSRDYKIGKSLCQEYSCCNVTSSNTCGINTFPKDQTTLVLPGGQTRCIYSYSTPFAFQVIPGDSDKLLFYFQGGGACWDEFSTDAGFCTSDANPQDPVGVFDRQNDLNSFKSYTIVHVLYCSGDIFGGNVVRPYNDKDGVPIQQVGLINAQSAVDWVLSQQHAGFLASTFADVVVMGCSAGSIGAQLWQTQITKSLKWTKASIIPDSYAGVFPDGSQGPLVYGYGFCESGFLNAANYEKCINQELTIQEINSQFIAEHPTVPTSFIQSKTDVVQMSFYDMVGFTTNTTNGPITPAEFYDEVNEIFESYNVNKNNVDYLIDGDQHCFSCYDLYYTADAISAHDNGKTNTGPMMYQWAGSQPLSEGESISTVCNGELQSSGSSKKQDNTYCDAVYASKEYVEHY